MDLTARLLAGVLRELGSQPAIQRAVLAVLPWARFLPPDALDELVTEFVNTTEAYADPELHAALTRSHQGDHGPVPPPEAV